ncbi:MAG: DUF3392 family protein [Endozoicomonas sp.]
MDWIAKGIIALSGLFRGHLSLIAMALTGVTMVYAGRTLSSWCTGWLGRLHGAFRIPARALLNLLLFGAVFYFVPAWLTTLFGYFNNYTLAPVLVIIFIAVGLLADRYGR